MERKILIIDDEREIGEIMKDFLEDSGYSAFWAPTAQAGLEIAGKEKPKVVFVDWILPKVNGYECLKALKALDPEMAVVMMSGLNDKYLAEQAVREGAVAYILKPFELSYLKDTLLPPLFPA